MCETNCAATFSRTEPDTSGIRIIPELEEEGWFAFGDMWRDIPCESASGG